MHLVLYRIDLLAVAVRVLNTCNLLPVRLWLVTGSSNCLYFEITEGNRDPSGCLTPLNNAVLWQMLSVSSHRSTPKPRSSLTSRTQGPHCDDDSGFIWGQPPFTPQRGTKLISFIARTDKQTQPKADQDVSAIWLGSEKESGSAINSLSVHLKGGSNAVMVAFFIFFFCRIKGDAGFSHLLKSIPLKLFKAEDVQDAKFESGVTGTKRTDRILWTRKEMSPVHGQSYSHLKLLTCWYTYKPGVSMQTRKSRNTFQRTGTSRYLVVSVIRLFHRNPFDVSSPFSAAIFSISVEMHTWVYRAVSKLWQTSGGNYVSCSNNTAVTSEALRTYVCSCEMTDFNGGFLITLKGLRWQQSLSDALNWRNTDAHTQTRCFTRGCRPVPAGSRWRCWPNSRRGVRRWPSPVGLCTALTSPPCGAEWSRHLTKGRDRAINLGRLG